MARPRVLLADDHSLLLEAFQRFLEPTCEVVGAVEDGCALLDAARTLRPDVAVVDIAMPRLNGLEAGRRLKEIVPLTKIIYLTMNTDPHLAVRATREGASGYLLKTSAGSELLHAIQLAMKGKRYVTPKIQLAMDDAFMWDPEGKTAEREFTPRQREVLQLLAEGKSMKEAADVLNVATRTIAFHKYRMMENFGIKTTAELIQMGIKKKVLVA